MKETNDLEKSYQCKIKLLEEDVEKLKTENKRLVEKAASYLKIIEDLSKGHSSTQNNNGFFRAFFHYCYLVVKTQSSIEFQN